MAPSNLSYLGNPFILRRNYIIQLTPTYTGYGTSFTISSGSLPSGLYLNSNNGIISGTPSSVTTGQYVTIRVANPLGYYNKELTFTVQSVATSCSGSVALRINRVTKENALQESFKIYSGTTTSGVYFQALC